MPISTIFRRVVRACPGGFHLILWHKLPLPIKERILYMALFDHKKTPCSDCSTRDIICRYCMKRTLRVYAKICELGDRCFIFEAQEILKNHGARKMKVFARGFDYLGQCKLSDIRIYDKSISVMDSHRLQNLITLIKRDLFDKPRVYFMKRF